MNKDMREKYPKGFLANSELPHDSLQFEYLSLLHTRLWTFVRHFYPGASGELWDYLDKVQAHAYNCQKTTQSVRDEENGTDS